MLLPLPLGMMWEVAQGNPPTPVFVESGAWKDSSSLQPGPVWEALVHSYPLTGSSRVGWDWCCL